MKTYCNDHVPNLVFSQFRVNITVSALFEPRGSIFQTTFLTSDCDIKKA